MKNRLFTLLALSIPLAYAGAFTFTRWEVTKTSYTNVAATTVWISSSTPNDFLVGVNVGSCGGTNSSFKLYDSSSNATGQLLSVNTSSPTATAGYLCSANGFYPLSVLISSGITYSITGNPDITILWDDTSSGSQ